MTCRGFKTAPIQLFSRAAKGDRASIEIRLPEGPFEMYPVALRTFQGFLDQHGVS